MPLKQKYMQFIAVFMTDLNSMINDELKDTLKESNISAEQSQVLWLLCQKGNLTLSDITRYQAVDKAAVSRRIKKLIEVGMVEWVNHPHGDQRFKYIGITEKGMQFTEMLNQTMFQKFENILDDIPEDKVDQAYEVLALVHQQMKEKNKTS